MNKRFFIILGILLLAVVGVGAFIKGLEIYLDVSPHNVQDYCEITIFSAHKVNLNVKILDPEGRNIRTLYRGIWHEKGTIPWDRTNKFGEYCSPGIYTVVASAFVNSRYTSTKKTFILK